MKTKPYPQIEEKPLVLEEPAVAYQQTDPNSYRNAYMKKEYTQEEINEIIDRYIVEDSEWNEMFSPYTMEQMNRWIEEGEAEDEEEMPTHEEVMSGLRSKFPWLS